MAYKDNYGITKIKARCIDNLSISWDANITNGEKTPKKNRYPVLLYTPDMNDTNTHYHVQLSRKEAKTVKDWLTEFLKDTKQKGKK